MALIDGAGTRSRTSTPHPHHRRPRHLTLIAIAIASPRHDYRGYDRAVRPAHILTDTPKCVHAPRYNRGLLICRMSRPSPLARTTSAQPQTHNFRARTNTPQIHTGEESEGDVWQSSSFMFTCCSHQVSVTRVGPDTPTRVGVCGLSQGTASYICALVNRGSGRQAGRSCRLVETEPRLGRGGFHTSFYPPIM